MNLTMIKKCDSTSQFLNAYRNANLIKMSGLWMHLNCMCMGWESWCFQVWAKLKLSRPVIGSWLKHESLQRRKTFYETIQTVLQCMRFFFVVSCCHPLIRRLARIHILYTNACARVQYWNQEHFSSLFFSLLLLIGKRRRRRGRRRKRGLEEKNRLKRSYLQYCQLKIAFPPLFSAYSQFSFFLFYCLWWWWWW